MVFDPLLLVMLLLLAFLVFTMYRNGKKRQRMQQELRDGLVVDAEVMLGSGIYGRIVSVDNEAQRAVINSAGGLLEVHTGAIAQLVPQTAAANSADADESADAAVDADAQAADADTAADKKAK